MRVQLHCIARIRVVYLKQVDLLASLMVQPSFRRAPFLLGPQRQNVGLVPTVHRGRKDSPSTNNIIEKNCLFCILSPVLLLPRALRNRSDHIDIPSTQHRSSKGSRTTHQSTKARIFQKIYSYLKSA